MSSSLHSDLRGRKETNDHVNRGRGASTSMKPVTSQSRDLKACDRPSNAYACARSCMFSRPHTQMRATINVNVISDERKRKRAAQRYARISFLYLTVNKVTVLAKSTTQLRRRKKNRERDTGREKSEANEGEKEEPSVYPSTVLPLLLAFLLKSTDRRWLRVIHGLARTMRVVDTHHTAIYGGVISSPRRIDAPLDSGLPVYPERARRLA